MRGQNRLPGVASLLTFSQCAWSLWFLQEFKLTRMGFRKFLYLHIGTCASVSNYPRAARALAMSIKILDKTTYAVAREDVDPGIAACHRFVLGYVWLAFSCHLEGRKLFKLRPKKLGSDTEGRFR